MMPSHHSLAVLSWAIFIPVDKLVLCAFDSHRFGLLILAVHVALYLGILFWGNPKIITNYNYNKIILGEFSQVSLYRLVSG